MGVTDVDPFIMGMTQAAGTLTPLKVAAGAVLIAAASNNLIKGIYAYSLADRKTGSAEPRVPCGSGCPRPRSAVLAWMVNAALSGALQAACPRMDRSLWKELDGGGRGIRTPGTLAGTAVFKTACFNRSHIPPPGELVTFIVRERGNSIHS